MGRPKSCNPCCREDTHGDPQYCTHRQYADNGVSADVEWSRNISPTGSNVAWVSAMAVADDGTLFVAGYMGPLSETKPASVVEAWSPEGEILWRTGVSGSIETLTVSGDYLWAAGLGRNDHDNVWKLDPSADGEILVAKKIGPQEISDDANALFTYAFEFVDSVDDGADGVYLAGSAIVRLDENGDVLSGVWNGRWYEGGEDQGSSISLITAYEPATRPGEGESPGYFWGIDRDGDDLYLSGKFSYAKECGTQTFYLFGTFAKLVADYEVDWLFNPLYPGTIQGIGKAVRVSGDDLFGIEDNCIVKMASDTGIGEVAKSPALLAIPPGPRKLAVSGDTVYAVGSQYLYAWDYDLELLWCEWHAGDVDGDETYGEYYAVAVGVAGSGGDAIVYAGGGAAGCDTSTIDPPECDDSACEIPDCDTYQQGPRGGVVPAGCDCDKELPCNDDDEPLALCLYDGTGGLADLNGRVELQRENERTLVGYVEAACGFIRIAVSAIPEWKIQFAPYDSLEGAEGSTGGGDEGTITDTFCSPNPGFEFTFEQDDWETGCCEAGTISGRFLVTGDTCEEPECGDCGDPHYNADMGIQGYLVNCGCEPVPCVFSVAVPANDCNLSGFVRWEKQPGSLQWNGEGTWSCGGSSGTWGFVTTFDCGGGGMMNGWSVSGSYTVSNVPGSTALSITITRTWCTAGAPPSVPFPGFWMTFPFPPCGCDEIDMPEEWPGGVTTDCCPDPTPATLVADVSATGMGGPGSGTISITGSGTSYSGTGSVSCSPAFDLTIELRCTEGMPGVFAWEYRLTSGSDTTGWAAFSGLSVFTSCDPFEAHIEWSGITLCGIGTGIVIDITE